MRITILVLLLILFMAYPAAAQPEAPTIVNIGYGQVVEDTITDLAFFDWWRINADEGDEIVVDMLAADGLQPLVGILDTGGNLIARTEDAESTVNGRIQLPFTIPAAGSYTIVATRVGNESGTSTGTYQLRVDRINVGVPDLFQQVTFRCDEGYEVTSAAVIKFGDDLEFQSGRNFIGVYGLDGFVPVLRIRITPASDNPPLEFCENDGRVAPGDTFTLPGEATVTVQPGEEDRVAQHVVAVRGDVEFIIGSMDGRPGRFIAVISGFAINDRNDVDIIDVGQGALAADESSLFVYMVAAQDSRLDPYMLLNAENIADVRECDDAGRRECEAVPAIRDAGVAVTSENLQIIGDRFDAGLRIDGSGPHPIELHSFDGRTDGRYDLIIIGELPPHD